MPINYRRWWELPDPEPPAQTTESIQQPEPPNWWETEDLTPPTVTQPAAPAPAPPDPYAKYGITQEYGNTEGAHVAGYSKGYNRGRDYGTPKGTVSGPKYSGTVVHVGRDPKWGLYMQVRDDDGYIQQYSHLDNVLVQQGDRVAAGQEAFVTGDSGYVTGPHLDYMELDPEGNDIDPSTYRGPRTGTQAPAPGVYNPNEAQQLAEWQAARTANGEDPNDMAAFNQHLLAIGAPAYSGGGVQSGLPGIGDEQQPPIDLTLEPPRSIPTRDPNTVDKSFYDPIRQPFPSSVPRDWTPEDPLQSQMDYNTAFHNAMRTLMPVVAPTAPRYGYPEEREAVESRGGEYNGIVDTLFRMVLGSSPLSEDMQNLMGRDINEDELITPLRKKAVSKLADEVDRYFDQFEPSARSWERLSEPIAGLATMSLRYNQAGRQITPELQDVIDKTPDDASPLEAMWIQGQLMYDNHPIPLVTGAFQDSFNPTNYIEIIGGVGIAKSKVQTANAIKALESLPGHVMDALGIIADNTPQLRKSVKRFLAEEGGRTILPGGTPDPNTLWDNLSIKDKAKLINDSDLGGSGLASKSWDDLPDEVKEVLSKELNPSPVKSFQPDRDPNILKVTNDEYLKAEAKEIPKTYAVQLSDELLGIDKTPSIPDGPITLSTSPSPPDLKVGQTLFDVDAKVENPKIFRSMEEYTAFPAPDGGDVAEYLKSQGYDSVYIPEADGQPGIMELLDESAVIYGFENPRVVTPELLERLSKTQGITAKAKQEGITPSASGSSTGRGGTGGGKRPPKDPPNNPTPHPGDDARINLRKNTESVSKLPGRSLKKQLQDLYTGIQASFADRLASANQLESMMEEVWKKSNPNTPLPPRLRIEALGAFAGGIPQAAMEHIKDMQDEIYKALGNTKSWKTPWADLGDYLRVQHEMDKIKHFGPDRKVANGIKDIEEAQLILSSMENALGSDKWERLKKAATTAINYSDWLLDRRVTEGLVDPELAMNLKLRYPHYFATRIPTDEFHPVTRGKGREATDNLVRRFSEEGTEKSSYHPVESIMQSMLETETQIARNKWRRAVGETLVELGMGERVSNVVPVTQIADGEAEQVFRLRRGAIKGHIEYMDNGGEEVHIKLDPNQVPEGLEEAANKLGLLPDHFRIPLWSGFIGVLRNTAVTYNPSFGVANFFFDWFNTVLTEMVPPQETLKGLIGAAKYVATGHDPIISKILKTGGGMSGYSLSRAEELVGGEITGPFRGLLGIPKSMLPATPRDIANTAYKEGAKVIRDRGDTPEIMADLQTLGSNAIHSYHMLRDFNKILELANRRAVATNRLRKAGVKVSSNGRQSQILAQQGVSIDKALMDATLAFRRASTDFGRGGYWTKQLDGLIPFFNVSVQGLLHVGRVARGDIGAPLAKFFAPAALAATATTLELWNRQYDTYDDVPAEVKRQPIVMLPSTEFDPATGRPKPNYYVILPTSFRDWSMLYSPMSYMVSAIAGKDTESFKRFGSNLFGKLSPISDAGETVPTPLLQTLLEMNINKDFYTGREIVPTDLKGKPLSEQYTEYTPKSIIWMANKLGVSPLILDHWVFSMGAGASRSIINAIEFAAGGRFDTPEDDRIQELVANLKEIGPIPTLRNRFLENLTPDERESVLRLEKRRPPSPPLLSDLERRFVGRRSGEVRQIGMEKAESEIGASAKDTQELSRIYDDAAKPIELEQRAIDAALDRYISGDTDPATTLPWPAWHKERDKISPKYRTALEAIGVQFPNAAQLKSPQDWHRWQTMVASRAGEIEDTRTVAQILAAGWRAIQPEASSEGGVLLDWDTYFQRREDYLSNLTPEEVTILDDHLASTRSERENEADRDLRAIKPYFELRGAIAQKDPKWTDAERALKNIPLGHPLEKEAKDRQDYKDWQKVLSREREQWRREHPELDELLLKHGYATRSIRELDDEKIKAQEADLEKALANLTRREMLYKEDKTKGNATALINADESVEEAKQQLEWLKGIIKDPTQARTPPPLPNVKKGSVPPVALLKNAFAENYLDTPYWAGMDPRLQRQIDDFYDRLNEETRLLTGNHILEWRDIKTSNAGKNAEAVKEMILSLVESDRRRLGGWKKVP